MTPEFKVALDEAMSDYCDFLYFGGEPGSLGSQLYFALSDQWPEVDKAGSCPLPRFFRARQAWTDLHQPGRAIRSRSARSFQSLRLSPSRCSDVFLRSLLPVSIPDLTTVRLRGAPPSPAAIFF